MTNKDVVLVSIFVSLTQIIITWEEGTSDGELPPSDWPMSVSVGYFLCFYVFIYFSKISYDIF